MPQNKFLPFIIGALVLVISAGIAFGTQPQPKKSPTTATSSSSNTASTEKSFAMTEVATHNSKTSCWTTINGNVYDVTAWISKHPGGAGAILSICGKDGSAAFSGQHGGKAGPEAELAGFIIGSLKK